MEYDKYAPENFDEDTLSNEEFLKDSLKKKKIVGLNAEEEFKAKESIEEGEVKGEDIPY